MCSNEYECDSFMKKFDTVPLSGCTRVAFNTYFMGYESHASYSLRLSCGTTVKKQVFHYTRL